MIGTVSPACPHTPQGGRKGDYREQEECAHNLQPDDAAYTAEGAEKTAYTFSNIAGRDFGTRRRSRGIGTLNGRVSDGLRLRGACSLRTVCNVLPGHAAGYANSYAQNPANGLRFHSIYDGSSDAG